MSPLRLVVHVHAGDNNDGDDRGPPDGRSGGTPRSKGAAERDAPHAGLPPITLDEALTQYIGAMGPGQWLNFILVGLSWLPGAVLILLLVFSIGSPARDGHWECVAADDTTCAAAQRAPDLAAALCALPRAAWRWTRPRDTLTSQFDLACGAEWKGQLANALFFIGYGIGSGAFGHMADALGRKACMFTSIAISAASVGAGALCTNYWAWLIMRVTSGSGVAGTSLGAYVLATETIGPSWRGTIGIATQVWFNLGEFVLVAVAVLAKTWQSQAAACAVMTGALLLLWPLLPESPRWLLARGRREDAYKVLELYVRRNRSSLPEAPICAGGGAPQDVTSAPATISPRGMPSAVVSPGGAGSAAAAALGTAGSAQGLPPPLTLARALTDWHLARRFAFMCFAYMAMCMSYYGISFALGGLPGSLEVSFVLSGLAELPSYAFSAWAIGVWGRHNTMAGCMLLGGAACAGCAFTPAGGGQTALASVGKFGVSAAFAIANVYSTELFPTLIRSAVLGAQNQAARIGAIAAPFVVLAGERRAAAAMAAGNTGATPGLVPFLSFGAASIVGALLVFTLPETLGAPLPDTLEDMGAIASIFTHKTLRTKGLRAAAASMFKTRVVLPASGGRGPGGAAGQGHGAPAAVPRTPSRGWWGRLSGRGGGSSCGGRCGGAHAGGQPPSGQQQRSIWDEDEEGYAAGALSPVHLDSLPEGWERPVTSSVSGNHASGSAAAAGDAGVAHASAQVAAAAAGVQ